MGMELPTGTLDATLLLEYIKENCIIVVNHGATAGTARPTGVTSVFWVGSVTPTNAIEGDLFQDTDGTTVIGF